MSRKKTGATPVAPPRQKKKQVIEMTKAELAKARTTPGFRTGRYMTEKDRPRKKNWKKWKKELERDNNDTGSFFMVAALQHPNEMLNSK